MTASHAMAGAVCLAHWQGTKWARHEPLPCYRWRIAGPERPYHRAMSMPISARHASAAQSYTQGIVSHQPRLSSVPHAHTRNISDGTYQRRQGKTFLGQDRHDMTQLHYHKRDPYLHVWFYSFRIVCT